MKNLALVLIVLLSLNSCTQAEKEVAVSEKPAAKDTSKGLSETKPDSTTAKTTPANSFIVPGKSIGKINLNEDSEVIQKILGKPTTANSAMGKSLQTWKLKTDYGKDYQLSIFFSRNMGNEDEKSRVKQIRITAAAFISEENEAATTSILRGNISEAKKTAVYTLPGSKGQFEIYDNIKTGIAFEFDPPGNVIAITIHEPGKPAFEIFSEVSSNLKKMKPSEQTKLPIPDVKE